MQKDESPGRQMPERIINVPKNLARLVKPINEDDIKERQTRPLKESIGSLAVKPRVKSRGLVDGGGVNTPLLGRSHATATKPSLDSNL